VNPTVIADPAAGRGPASRGHADIGGLRDPAGPATYLLVGFDSRSSAVGRLSIFLLSLESSFSFAAWLRPIPDRL